MNKLAGRYHALKHRAPRFGGRETGQAAGSHGSAVFSYLRGRAVNALSE